MQQKRRVEYLCTILSHTFHLLQPCSRKFRTGLFFKILMEKNSQGAISMVHRVLQKKTLEEILMKKIFGVLSKIREFLKQL